MEKAKKKKRTFTICNVIFVSLGCHLTFNFFFSSRLNMNLQQEWQYSIGEQIGTKAVKQKREARKEPEKNTVDYLR
jgi:hypothetical protein